MKNRPYISAPDDCRPHVVDIKGYARDEDLRVYRGRCYRCGSRIQLTFDQVRAGAPYLPTLEEDEP